MNCTSSHVAHLLSNPALEYSIGRPQNFRPPHLHPKKLGSGDNIPSWTVRRNMFFFLFLCSFWDSSLLNSTISMEHWLEMVQVLQPIAGMGANLEPGGPQILANFWLDQLGPPCWLTKPPDSYRSSPQLSQLEIDRHSFWIPPEVLSLKVPLSLLSTSWPPGESERDLAGFSDLSFRCFNDDAQISILGWCFDGCSMISRIFSVVWTDLNWFQIIFLPICRSRSVPSQSIPPNQLAALCGDPPSTAKFDYQRV